MGGAPAARAAELHSFVLDTALAVVADAFDLDGIVLAGREAGEPTFLATRLPPSWSTSSPAVFELYGRLHGALADHAEPDSADPVAGDEPADTTWQCTIGGSAAWLARLTSVDAPVVAAAVRPGPLSVDESEALLTIIGSVLVALSGRSADDERRERLRSNLVVSVDQAGEGVSAVVHTLDRPEAGPGLTILGGSCSAEGPDMATAVARAAAGLCRPPCDVTFAGSSAVDGNAISIVIVRDRAGKLRLGFSVGASDEPGGIAEAVLTTAG